MDHRQLPSERRLKGFATERMGPVIEYLVLWHQFLLIGEMGIDSGSDFGTDSADMHAQREDEIGCIDQTCDAVAELADRGMSALLPSHRP